jgi:hypothetical protein
MQEDVVRERLPIPAVWAFRESKVRATELVEAALEALSI